MSSNGHGLAPLIYCHNCKKMTALPFGTIIPDRSAEVYNSWRKENKCPTCKNMLDSIRLG